MKKQQISAGLTEAVNNQIKIISEQERRSFSDMVLILLEEALETRTTISVKAKSSKK